MNYDIGNITASTNTLVKIHKKEISNPDQKRNFLKSHPWAKQLLYKTFNHGKAFSRINGSNIGIRVAKKPPSEEELQKASPKRKGTQSINAIIQDKNMRVEIVFNSTEKRNNFVFEKIIID